MQTPEEVRLSSAQERLWYLDQFEDGCHAYHVCRAFRLRGSLQPWALQDAVQRAVARHEALRTIYDEAGGEVRGLVREPGPVEWREFHAGDGNAGRLLTEEARRPFAIFRNFPIRASLIRANDEHVFLLAIHHIAIDGWSLSILFREIAADYAAIVSGESEPVQQPATPYSHHAEEEIAFLNSPEYGRQLDYWKSRLAGLEVLELAGDLRRPAERTHRGGLITFEIPAPTSVRLSAFCRSFRATPFPGVAAVLTGLLRRYSGQSGIAIGYPVAHRNRVKWERTVGCFVNMLVLRTNPTGDPSFRELAESIRRDVLEGISHQDVPFERLARELNPDRYLSHTPVVQVSLAYQNIPESVLDLPGVEVEPVSVSTGGAKFDLSLAVTPVAAGLQCALEYSADLFSPTAAERFAGQFVRLLDAAIEHPDAPIDRLDILTDAERSELLRMASGPQETIGPCFLERFAQVVRDRPGSVAATSDGVSVTYRDIDRQSDRIAAALAPHGGKSIAVKLKRSVEILPAIVGIWKAGCVYVPLDASAPAARNDWIIQDSGAAKVIADDTVFTAANSTPVRSSAGQPVAYLLYTSGSSGTPKGVEITHASLANLLDSAQQEMDLGPGDTFAAVSSFAFDASVFDLVCAMACGARVVITTEEEMRDPELLAELIERHSVTMMLATPTTWSMLLEAGWPGSAVLKAITGGEPLTQELAARLLPRTRSLANCYGPTETTLWASCDRVREGESISIGRPIRNSSLHVLTAQGLLQPVGIPGEICIGGAGVGRGYRNRPDLNAGRFIADPLAPGHRLYRTGDWGRLLPDGRFECLGRMDRQVKLRGYRVELEEIERVLNGHAGVSQCAVAIRETTAGHPLLAAYVVTRPNAAFDANELRDHGAAKLPGYMVPSVFVETDSIPRSLSGKTNRKALPPLPAPAAAAGRREGELETRITGVWRDCLGVSPRDLHESFFAAGGHSLLAMRFLMAIEKELGRKIPLAVLYRTPTIAGLASHLRRRRAPACPLYWIDALPQQWRLAAVMGDAVEVVAMYLEPADCAKAELESMAWSLAKRIEKMQPDGPLMLGGWCAAGTLSYEVARYLSLHGRDVEQLVLLDSRNPAVVPVAGLRVVAGKVRHAFRNLAQANLFERAGRFARRTAGVGASPVEKALVAALARYQPRPYAGSILLVRPEEEGWASMFPSDLGWKGKAAELVVIRAPGDHNTMFETPHVEVLAAEIRRHLRRAEKVDAAAAG